MAKKKNWLTYAQASQIAVEAGCKSRRQFMDWHEEKGIADIPKQPNRVYSEWDGWPAFLDTGNVFAADKDKQTHYRTYWEAVRWAQTYCSENKITTGQGWKHAYNADAEQGKHEIPTDIPKHPENYYSDDWSGWPTWLGKSVQAKIAAARQEIAVIAIATSPNRAQNIISVVVAKDGEGQLLDLLFQKGLMPTKIYKFDKELATEIQQIVAGCSTLQPDGSWICRNVHQLHGDLGYLLEFYTPENVAGFRNLYNPMASPDDDFEVEDNTHITKLTNGPSTFI